MKKYENQTITQDLQGAGHNISTATIVQLRVSRHDSEQNGFHFSSFAFIRSLSSSDRTKKWRKKIGNTTLLFALDSSPASPFLSICWMLEQCISNKFNTKPKTISRGLFLVHFYFYFFFFCWFGWKLPPPPSFLTHRFLILALKFCGFVDFILFTFSSTCILTSCCHSIVCRVSSLCSTFIVIWCLMLHLFSVGGCGLLLLHFILLYFMPFYSFSLQFFFCLHS